MVRLASAASVLAAMALAAGCTGADAGPGVKPVPIASVTEVAAFSGGGLLSVHVDDFRGCPTAFSVAADETAEEIRLTAGAFKGENHECGQAPTVALKSPVGNRRIIDATHGLPATTVIGEQLKEPCEGVDRCFSFSEDGLPQGRTFRFVLADPREDP